MPLVPVVPDNCSHVLAEFDCLDPLLSALRLDSGRLKCTCLAVSRKWLALGTSAGGLHLIQREGWKQRLFLIHKEGSITHLACCPHDEDFIAVATSQGLVVVWELQLERRGRPERVSVSWEHRGQAITAVCWDTSVLKVYVGDSAGKVSYLRAGSTKLGKGSAFVMFPVQTVATVDSRVVQLGYHDGRLLVSSLSRCYLCDTEREKFWRVGSKERDGEYGACFLPQFRGSLGASPPLLYCARPGSRIWEASFNGEVLSTHQFKQLLACPSLPLISYRTEPNYNPLQKSPQSIAFTKLLYFGDQNLLTWTDSAIYILTPHNGQLLLWTEVKDLLDVAVYRNELFCLHASGRLSHFSLLSAERCVERLLRREAWPLAATVCCMFQQTITTSRARKSIPIDRLEHLKAQLSVDAHQELIGQLEEVLTKLEPLDSASSSRRSSISSHESFNVLDCGIYRVISRRGSQSDEETGSVLNQSTSEEERLKEFSFVQEEDQADPDPQSRERMDTERSEPGMQFHLPLSFRPKPPRIALQAVKDSVSSFVKKTTEKINTLQMNSELWQRPELREGFQAEVFSSTSAYAEEMANEGQNEVSTAEMEMQELLLATDQAITSLQDPLVLLDSVCLEEVLLEWLPFLERILGPDELQPAAPDDSIMDESEEDDPQESSTCSPEEQNETLEPDVEGRCEVQLEANKHVAKPIRVTWPKPVPSDLQAHLSELATLYTELSCFGNTNPKALECQTFLCRYFFLLDHERVRRMCLLCHQDQPQLMSCFMEAMLELTQSCKVVEVIHRGDLSKSLRSLRELQPRTPPSLLAHLHRLAFLQSVEPQSLREDWLELALTHHAPPLCDTLTPDHQPRWRSHSLSWGYHRLLSLLIRLPSDFHSKQKMAATCYDHGYWSGYLYLCKELQQRTEAFSTICQLDDIRLLEEPDGVEPQTLDEWKFLIRHCASSCASADQLKVVNGEGSTNGSTVIGGRMGLESVMLLLARTVGSDSALSVLEDCGVQVELSDHSKLLCELLRLAERRQRALIQTMLERCDRFLWSQHA
uniref:Hermansky-Pudlak syndrome 5 protein homolog n=1 Tax=Gouania willdenowi TaxID=441366 RepID=A0A8C5N9A5_GOUWI